ncbi:MAG: hypothetical protein CMF49_02705 [Legionellales bacterium]|nr:hypothetical protein [Legionellales bacterium]|tara:strand:+ start:393 stop:662 length:270 start_codon:yes stop_codon:yes gene_type:complete
MFNGNEESNNNNNEESNIKPIAATSSNYSNSNGDELQSWFDALYPKLGSNKLFNSKLFNSNLFFLPAHLSKEGTRLDEGVGKEFRNTIS